MAGAPLALAAGTADDPLEGEVVRLYGAHCAGLSRYALTLTRDRQLAEDVLQESFLRYFLARKEGQLIRNPRAWLYQVLHNLLLDDRKRMGFRAAVCLDAALESPDREQDPEARMQRRELSDGLRLVLSPREMECVRLRVEGLGYEEIASVLQIRPGTVGALLARALKKTQKILRRKGRDR
jgi:RNA polymerase sigma-70 factor (ECF subfamily)